MFIEIFAFFIARVSQPFIEKQTTVWDVLSAISAEEFDPTILSLSPPIMKVGQIMFSSLLKVSCANTAFA
ncbi:MAG: hypothetical protein ACLSIL_14055 [Enterococcus casseliflavus]